MNNKYKIILAITFVLSLLIGARYSYGQTTTVTVNGNTTTTTTITNTPVSTTVVPNTPNIGDLTTTTINQATTDITTKVANTNSGNLVPTNFCDNSWTGTQKTASPSGNTSDLGCNYITGKNTTTYLENNVNLVEKGITKQEQNLGLTQSASAHTYHYWSWNSYLNFSHSITNNDTGATITQNREWNHNNSIPGSTKSLDNIIIGENSASGYTSKMRFDSSSSGGNATWQGVDIKDPNLSITYNKLTSTSSSLQTTTTSIISCESLGTCYVAPVIEKIDEKFIEVIKEAVKIEEAIKFEDVFKEEMKVEVSTAIETMEQTKIDSPVMSSMMNTITEEPKTTTSVAVSDSPTVSIKEEPKTTSVTSEEPKTTTTVVNEEPKTTTTVASEEPKSTTIAKEETTSTKMTSEEPKETTTSTKESNATTSSDKETTSVSEKTNTNTDTKSEESKTTTSQSATNENQKAEGSQTEKVNEKVVSDKSVTTNEKGTVNVGVNSIETKVKTAIEKVEREVKSIDQKTRAIQEIKLEGLKSGAPNLSVYENKNFYDPRQMVGTPNPDFFNQINIEQQQIYKDVSLSAYTNRDPIAVKQALQMEIEEEMNKLILEIEILKRS